MPLDAAPNSPLDVGWAFWPNRDVPDVEPNAGALKPVAGFANDDCPKGVVGLVLPKPPKNIGE